MIGVVFTNCQEVPLFVVAEMLGPLEEETHVAIGTNGVAFALLVLLSGCIAELGDEAASEQAGGHIRQEQLQHVYRDLIVMFLTLMRFSSL